MAAESRSSLVSRLVDHLTTAVMVLGGRLRVAYLNPAAEMLFAVSARQTQDMEVATLFPGADGFIQSLRQAVATGHPFTERELALPVHYRDGAITVDCTVSPLLEPDREPGLLVELQPVDRHLRIAREEALHTQHVAARALLRGLAHEIKNPLGGLRGAAQLLERELPDPGLREFTGVIIGEADRLQKLVDRMVGPSGRPQKRWLNLHEALERVRALVSAEAPASVSLRRDYDPSLPDIHADVDQLIQAFLNLVRNAAQAVGERGNIVLRTRIQRQYTIAHARHRLVARVDIEDDGPGIPAEIREHLFLPMISGRAGGTGLGLSIAQALVHQHGGLIECSSQPGRTVFSTFLPLESAHE